MKNIIYDNLCEGLFNATGNEYNIEISEEGKYSSFTIIPFGMDDGYHAFYRSVHVQQVFNDPDVAVKVFLVVRNLWLDVNNRIQEMKENNII